MKKEYLIPTRIYGQLIKKLRTPGECKSGRPDIGSEEDAKGKKIYQRKVAIDKKGYDKGGAYWGTEKSIYVKYTIDKSYVRFTETKEETVQKRSDVAIAVYKKILRNVNSSSGAPMGRANVGTLEEVKGQKIYQRKIALNKGYDIGGAYWGNGDPLYVDFTLDGKYAFFHREHYGN
jgi:hypothetical protein